LRDGAVEDEDADERVSAGRQVVWIVGEVALDVRTRLVVDVDRGGLHDAVEPLIEVGGGVHADADEVGLPGELTCLLLSSDPAIPSQQS
jgi:hypothetical protein